MICPVCSYDLVLLKNRRKYKCASCSRLFLQKSTEAKEFSRKNKNQRKIDLHKFNIELKQNKRKQLTEEEKKLRSKEYSSKYLFKNKDKLKALAKEFRANNKEDYNKYLKEWRKRDLEKRRLYWRMDSYRQKQKLLTLQQIKSKEYRASNSKIKFYPPTMSLSQLLKF